MSLDQQYPPPPGQPGQPGQPGYPGFPPPQPPSQGTSGLAIAGLILSFLIAPIGFILSLIAVFKTGAGRAKGRGLAIAGIIISLLVMGGGIAIVVAASKSTVVDPGCVDGKNAILNSVQGGNAKDVQNTIDALNKAAAKAKHDNVRDAMKAVATDYTQILDAAKNGKDTTALMNKLQKDADNIDSLCTIGS